MRNFRKMNEICVRMIDRSSERDGIATSCEISVSLQGTRLLEMWSPTIEESTTEACTGVEKLDGRTSFAMMTDVWTRSPTPLYAKGAPTAP